MALGWKYQKWSPSGMYLGHCGTQGIILRRLVVLTECSNDDRKIAHWFRHSRSKKKELLEQESSTSSIRVICNENGTPLAGNKRSVTPNPPPGEI